MQEMDSRNTSLWERFCFVGCLLCLMVRSFTRALLVSVSVSYTSAVLKLHQTTVNYATNTHRQMVMECRERLDEFRGKLFRPLV